MAARIRKDDMVVVVAGRSKGERGRVLRILRSTNRVLVEGVNRVKRHSKPNNRQQEGGIVEKEAAIDLSNVMLLDSKADKPTRVRFSSDKEGKKVRIAVKSGVTVES